MHSEPNRSADDELREKEHALVRWLRTRGSALIGFSGGVDSAYLACVAVDALGNANVLAVIGKSASYPAAQWAAARDVARRFAVPVLEIDTDELVPGTTALCRFEPSPRS